MCCSQELIKYSHPALRQLFGGIFICSPHRDAEQMILSCDSNVAPPQPLLSPLPALLQVQAWHSLPTPRLLP